jgi:hypothetical protein
MKTIIIACLMMFLPPSVCPAGADSDQSVCPAWNDTDQSVCPAWNDTDQSVCPAYQTTATLGERVLAIGDKIVANGTRRAGACWDFVNTVYNCAGYTEKRRTAVFGSIKNEQGPYLEDMNMIQPGDWIMHINFDYHPQAGITHSAIFVGWKDKEQKIAITLDYVGEKRCAVGHYSEHTLTKVYCIYRAIPSKEEATK